MQKEYTKNGILYTWELASSEGASFILFPSATNTKEEIETAKNDIRNSQDVVWMKVANDDDRDYLYKSEIFRIPETRDLKWYQIAQDDKVLRKCRLQGLTPQQYVDKIVLPFIKETEAAFLETHGTKIYGI